MDDDTRRLIDDINFGDVLEIEYCGLSKKDVRVGVGVFEGFAKNEFGEWVIQRLNRPDIAAFDIKSIRILPQVKEGANG
jgi:hypothetical protein